jgi:hypothetical protein
MWFRSLWNWFIRTIWKSLEKGDRESLECCKQSLMGNSSGSSEDQSANRNTDSKDCAHEVSDGNKDSTGS